MASKAQIMNLANENWGLVLGVTTNLGIISSKQQQVADQLVRLLGTSGEILTESTQAKERAREAARQAQEAVNKGGEVLSKAREILNSVGRVLQALAVVGSIISAIAGVVNALNIGELFIIVRRIENKIDGINQFITRTIFSLRDQLMRKLNEMAGALTTIDGRTLRIRQFQELTLAPTLVQLGENVRVTFQETIKQGLQTRILVKNETDQIDGAIEGSKNELKQAITAGVSANQQAIEGSKNSILDAIRNNPQFGQILSKLGQIAPIALGVAATGATVAGIYRVVTTTRPGNITGCRFAPDPYSPIINTAVAGTVVPNSIIAVRNTNTIITRVGPQVAGGITGFMQRIVNNSLVDKAVNLANLYVNLHNAYWLSNGLTQTLFSAISNSMAAFGLRDPDGNPIDVGAIVGNQIENMAKALLGVENVNGIKAGWAKYSRIYQAASNIVWSIQSIMYSVQSVLEIVGEWIARIGNTLRRDGVVRENAFQWMNEDMVSTRTGQMARFEAVLNGIENVENVVSQVDSVASEVLSIQDTLTQLGEQKTEFENALVDAIIPTPPKPDNEPVKQKFEADKASSQSTVTPEDEQRPD